MNTDEKKAEPQQIAAYRAALLNVTQAAKQLADAIAIAGELGRVYDPDPASTAPGIDDAAAAVVVAKVQQLFAPIFDRYAGARQLFDAPAMTGSE